MQVSLGNKLNIPWFSVSMFGISIFIGTCWVLYTKNDLHILTGTEIAFMALGSLYVNNHIGILVRLLLILGVCFPFLIATLSPLYFEHYSWFITKGFWWMFGLGVIPGVLIFVLGIFIYSEMDSRSLLSQQENKSWPTFIDYAFKIWIILTLCGVFYNLKFIYMAFIIFSGFIVFLIGLLLVLPYRYK